MKNLQINNPTIGAQSFKLADKAGEDTYIYNEVDLHQIKEIKLSENSGNYSLFLQDERFGSKKVSLTQGKEDLTFYTSDNRYIGTSSQVINIDFNQDFYLAPASSSRSEWLKINFNKSKYEVLKVHMDDTYPIEIRNFNSPDVRMSLLSKVKSLSKVEYNELDRQLIITLNI